MQCVKTTNKYNIIYEIKYGYDVKEELKQLGFTWDSEKQCWILVINRHHEYLQQSIDPILTKLSSHLNTEYREAVRFLKSVFEDYVIICKHGWKGKRAKISGLPKNKRDFIELLKLAKGKRYKEITEIKEERIKRYGRMPFKSSVNNKQSIICLKDEIKLNQEKKQNHILPKDSRFVQLAIDAGKIQKASGGRITPKVIEIRKEMQRENPEAFERIMKHKQSTDPDFIKKIKKINRGFQRGSPIINPVKRR